MQARRGFESHPVRHSHATLARFVNLAGGKAVLVRPDGQVAAIIPPSQTAALAGTLQSLLGKALSSRAAA